MGFLPFDLIARVTDKKVKGVIQVGAHNAEVADLYKESGIPYAIFIDPLDSSMHSIRKMSAGMPHYHAVQALVSDVDDEIVDFNVASNWGASSSMLAPAGHFNEYPDITFDERIRMPTSSLDTIVSDILNTHPLDKECFNFLFMDVQGAEMNVLIGAPKVLRNIDFVWTEVSFGGLYKGDTNIYDMISFLRIRGFDLWYANINEKRWGDALFIKEKK
ncbi:FkbM family methyltransferase [Xanthobacter aminoxidans]|nr:FkbM family methyltransferase [Xanthobacter aminoxidans]MCL8382357.1 FkbM family methyltransferase [Xanthobacter aminoxidans]